MTSFNYKALPLPDGEVIFDVNAQDIGEKISSKFIDHIVSISTPSALSNGNFQCFVELVKDGGFHSVNVLGSSVTTLNASNVGATVADGDVDAFSFQGSPYRVKIVATGVNGASECFVVISQSGG